MGFDLFFTGRRRTGLLVLIIFLDVLHDERDVSVGRIERRFRLAESLIGEAADLNDLVGAHSIGLHDAASGIGAIGREFPVPISSRRSIGLGIGMAFDGEFVGQTADFLCELDEQFGSIGLQLGAAAVEKSAAGGF